MLARIPAASGAWKIELTTSGSRFRDPAAVEWSLPATDSPTAVFGLEPPLALAKPLVPFVQAYPELSALVGLPETVAELDLLLASMLDAPVSVQPSSDGPRIVPTTHRLTQHPRIASLLANQREQVLVAIQVGQLSEVPVLRGYEADVGREGGVRPAWEEVWIAARSFVTHAEVRVDEWRLQQEWYESRPWNFRAGLPRRDGLSGLLGVPYGLFPRGMHRTLFGSYILHVIAQRDLLKACGPPPLGKLDQTAAARALPVARFPHSAVHDAVRADPERALCDRALNGIHPFALRGPGALRMAFPGVARIPPAGARSAGTVVPGVRVDFELAADRLRVREVAAVHGGESWRAGPGDRAWEQLLHLARSALLLAGELDVHVMTHLLAEHVQVALRVSGLPEAHPLFRLLAPHVDGADVINTAGDWLILGDDGAIGATTPLTGADITVRAGQALADAYQGWPAFAPRAAIGADDRYARAAGVFWAALDGYVSAALGAGALDPAASTFLSTLARHAPGLFPVPTTLAELVQFCKFVVFHCTFLHTWVNDAQWDDGGDPSLSPLAARALPNPILPYPTWASLAAPTPANHGYQQVLSHALTRFDVGSAVHEDVVPRALPSFRAMVEALGAPFVDHHPADRRLERGWIRSRVNS